MPKVIDIAGQRFGRLVAVAHDGFRRHSALWTCQCDCGNVARVASGDLRGAHTLSCGCLKRERISQTKLLDLTGRRFGRLHVITRADDIGPGNARWMCRCDCGNFIVVRSPHLSRGKTKSCGCFREEMHRTHGRSQEREYRSWCSMKSRCTNPNSPSYRRYGGRGIKVCERWQSFENFYADMGQRPANKSIDRINNDGNYEPGNCRWADRLTQNRNRVQYARRQFTGRIQPVSEVPA